MLEVLYEDNHLLAVNKPAGQVVHPSFRNSSGTLINGLLERARAWPAGSVPALVGRLDKLTSGVVLVSKRSEIHAALQRAMAARRIDKDYLAIVAGKPSPARGTIDLALDRDPWDRRRITVTDRGGQPSVTRYERVVFEKDLVAMPRLPLAEFLTPGHPLLDATIDLILSRFSDLLRRGGTLVDRSDSSQDPRVLLFLEHTIADQRPLRDGRLRRASQRLDRTSREGARAAGAGGRTRRCFPLRPRPRAGARAEGSTVSGCNAGVDRRR